jgi:hypothetical protein
MDVSYIQNQRRIGQDQFEIDCEPHFFNIFLEGHLKISQNRDLGHQFAQESKN